MPPFALDELLRKELAEGDNVALNSFIFSMANIHFLQAFQLQQFAAKAQARIAELENELKRKD